MLFKRPPETGQAEFPEEGISSPACQGVYSPSHPPCFLFLGESLVSCAEASSLEAGWGWGDLAVPKEPWNLALP